MYLTILLRMMYYLAGTERLIYGCSVRWIEVKKTMSETVFDAEDGETVTVLVGTSVESVKSPATVEAIKNIAKAYHIGKFTISDGTGRILKENDFPYSGEKIVIEQYNEAKA